VRGGCTSALPFWVAQLPGTPWVLVWYNFTVPEVTGNPPDVTVITADAGENCATLAEGTKLSVVKVDGGLPADTAVLARSRSAAGPLKLEIIDSFIKVLPFLAFDRQW